MVPYVVVWYEIFASLQGNVAVEQLVCEHPAQYVPSSPSSQFTYLDWLQGNYRTGSMLKVQVVSDRLGATGRTWALAECQYFVSTASIQGTGYS
jgi:hypothetical protein